MKTQNLRVFVLSLICDSQENFVEAAQNFLLSFRLEANMFFAADKTQDSISMLEMSQLDPICRIPCFLVVKECFYLFWDKLSLGCRAGLSANMLDITSSGQNIGRSPFHFFSPQSDPKTRQQVSQPQMSPEVTFQTPIQGVTWSRWWRCVSLTGGWINKTYTQRRGQRSTKPRTSARAGWCAGSNPGK